MAVPWFRFIDDLRVTIPFRNGCCELTFAHLDGAEPWAWVAQRHDKPSAQIVLVQAGNILGLRAALARDGFEVVAGSAAEKVMRAAESAGL